MNVDNQSQGTLKTQDTSAKSPIVIFLLHGKLHLESSCDLLSLQ